MRWRQYSDWAKHRQMTLRVADYLGRGRGRFRVLDRVSPPPRPLHTPDLRDWQAHDLAAAWIGHATVLLRVGSLTILTDPVLSPRIGVGLGLITGGPRRLVAPALSLRQFPAIDLILISHAHFDHLDRPTLQRLPRTIPVITAPRTRDLIADIGFGHVTELRWGEQSRVADALVTACRVRHWGARTFYDDYRGFNAYLIESQGRRILYGGDTAYHDHFRDVGKVDLAILGISAYNPYIAAHATPEQALEMADHLRADFILPMHHSTFQLSHEPVHEPMERLLAAAGRLQDRIIIREIGQSWMNRK